MVIYTWKSRYLIIYGYRNKQKQINTKVFSYSGAKYSFDYHYGVKIDKQVRVLFTHSGYCTIIILIKDCNIAKNHSQKYSKAYKNYVTYGRILL